MTKVLKREKRLSPRNLVLDLMSQFHKYNKELIEIDQAFKNNLFDVYENNANDANLDWTNYKKSPYYRELKVQELAKQLYNDISPIIFEYGIRATENIEDTKEIVLSLDEECSYHELLAYIVNTIKNKDADIVEFHLLNGDYLKAFNRLQYFACNSSELSNQLLFNTYQKALNQIIMKSEHKEELKSQFNRLQFLVRKERPRAPIEVQDHKDIFLCPYCHKELFKREQHYCHYCAQKISQKDRTQKQ